MRRTLGLAIVSSTALLLASASAAASGLVVRLDNGDYASSQARAFWDVSNSESSCSAGTVFTPLEDSSYLGNGDAFDGGFVVVVSGIGYLDPDGLATVSSGTLRTGAPALVNAVDVSATARALQTGPTLQYLVRIHNGGSTSWGGTVSIESNMGSDQDTKVLGSSTGDLLHRDADRWVVSGDAATGPFDDPVVTQAFHGKSSKIPGQVAVPLGEGAPVDCVQVDYAFSAIPAGGTRYLLLFAELHDSTNAGKAAAIKAAAAYTGQATLGARLAGIPKRIYPQIVNWTLKP